jgi:hypothetical protein
MRRSASVDGCRLPLGRSPACVTSIRRRRSADSAGLKPRLPPERGFKLALGSFTAAPVGRASAQLAGHQRNKPVRPSVRSQPGAKRRARAVTLSAARPRPWQIQSRIGHCLTCSPAPDSPRSLFAPLPSRLRVGCLPASYAPQMAAGNKNARPLGTGVSRQYTYLAASHAAHQSSTHAELPRWRWASG